MKNGSITADKSWVTSAGHADSYVVSTRSAGGKEPIETTLFFVPKGSAGLNLAGPWTGLGLRGNASAPMSLKNVAVAAADQLSADGKGFDAMINIILPWFQLGQRRGFRRHLSGRDGRRATTPVIGEARTHGPGAVVAAESSRSLAKMQIMTDAQTAFLDHVAGKMENPQPDTMLAVLESKAAANEAALQVTDLAMRTCGGTAFSGHLTVERNFRDARAGSIMAPTTEVLYDFIGKAVLGLPLF